MLELDESKLLEVKSQLPYTFKDEKAICTFLGVAYKRNKQEREHLIYGQGENCLGRYAKVEKVEGSRARVVTEVYDEPLPCECKRSPYKQNLESTLLYQLSKLMKPDGGIQRIVVDWSVLAECAYMTNPNFFDWKRWYHDTAAVKFTVSLEHVEIYRMMVWPQMKRYLKTALNALKKDGHNGYIQWNDVIVFGFERAKYDWEYEIGTKEDFARYQEIYYDILYDFSVAGEEEKKGVKLSQEEKRKLAAKNFSDILREGKAKKFYQRLHQAIHDEFGADYYTMSCEVVSSPKLLAYALKEQEAKQRSAAHGGYLTNRDMVKRFEVLTETQMLKDHRVEVDIKDDIGEDGEGAEKKSSIRYVRLNQSQVEFLAQQLIALPVEDYDLEFAQRQADKLANNLRQAAT